jgi:hypothetical protein
LTRCRERAKLRGTGWPVTRMMKSKPRNLFMMLSLSSAVLPTASLAQGSAENESANGPEAAEPAPTIRAVERGLFFEGDVGVGYLFSSMKGRDYGLTFLTGVYLGYDILPMLNVAIGGTFLATSVNEDRSGPMPQGDLFYAGPGIRADVAVLSDERNHLWLRAGAAYAFGLPSDIEGTPYNANGPMFQGGVGYEYFLTLRHFSLGVFAGVFVVTKPDVGVGFTVTPTVKYTF